MNGRALSSLKNYIKRLVIIRDQPGADGRPAASFICIGLVVLLWYVLTLGRAEERIIDAHTLAQSRRGLEFFPASVVRAGGGTQCHVEFGAECWAGSRWPLPSECRWVCYPGPSYG